MHLSTFAQVRVDGYQDVISVCPASDTSRSNEANGCSKQTSCANSASNCCRSVGVTPTQGGLKSMGIVVMTTERTLILNHNRPSAFGLGHTG